MTYIYNIIKLVMVVVGVVVVVVVVVTVVIIVLIIGQELDVLPIPVLSVNKCQKN